MDNQEVRKVVRSEVGAIICRCCARLVVAGFVLSIVLLIGWGIYQVGTVRGALYGAGMLGNHIESRLPKFRACQDVKITKGKFAGRTGYITATDYEVCCDDGFAVEFVKVNEGQLEPAE